MIDWDRHISRADARGLLVRFSLTGPRPIETILIDLIGDGEPGWQVTLDPTDGRDLRAIAVLPPRVGAFNLVVSATDVLGCSDTTGLVRLVTVVP
ncbi:MAG: hypothetical protein ACREJC_10930 [Tepidisphaeraceae bacterium]